MGDQSKNLIKTPLTLFQSESQPRDLQLEGLGALHQSAERECHERWRIFFLLPATVYLDIAGPPHVPLTLLLAT